MQMFKVSVAFHNNSRKQKMWEEDTLRNFRRDSNSFSAIKPKAQSRYDTRSKLAALFRKPLKPTAKNMIRVLNKQIHN